jgi:hypothetical protein
VLRINAYKQLANCRLVMNIYHSAPSISQFESCLSSLKAAGLAAS